MFPGFLKLLVIRAWKIMKQILAINRSSRPGVFYKKGGLKNFTKITGKHLC